MKYCTNCGKKLNEGASFCTSCGKSVEVNNDVIDKPNVIVKKKKFPVWAILLIVFVVIFCFFVFVGLVFFNFGKFIYDNTDLDNNYNTTDTIKYGSIGDTLVGDEFSVSLIDAVTYKTINSTYKDYDAKEGYMYIVYYVKAVNITSETQFFNYLYWDANCDGTSVKQTIIAGDIVYNNVTYEWATGSVGVGESITGYIIYEIPMNSNKFDAIYDENPYAVGKALEFRTGSKESL